MDSKMLFISSFIGQNNSGGSVAGARNLKFCQELVEGMQVDGFGFSFREAPMVKGIKYLPSHKNAFSTFVNYCFGNAGSIRYPTLKKILSLCKNNRYSVVFIDGSLLGRLAKKIKQQNKDTLIIIFFHNVEKHFFKSKLAKRPLFLPIYFSAAYNEKLSAKYADFILAFNNRDACGIKKLYGRDVYAVLPITVVDSLKQADKLYKCAANNGAINLLFVGSDFYANTEGIKWFIKHVMPTADATLIVAGKGMEKYRDELENEKVKIYGTVADLNSLYYNADLIVAPIFSGSGMKVKIAEALMMGKTIAGTDEAWQGYEVVDKISGFVCNTAEDFLGIINSRPKNFYKFNPSARSMYEKFYSPQALDPLTRKLGNEIKEHIRL